MYSSLTNNDNHSPPSHKPKYLSTMHNRFSANGEDVSKEVAANKDVQRKTTPLLAELRKGFDHDDLNCREFTAFPMKEKTKSKENGEADADAPVCRMFAPGKWIAPSQQTTKQQEAMYKKMGERAGGRATIDTPGTRLPGFRGDFLVFNAALAGKDKAKAARLTTEHRVVKPVEVKAPTFKDERSGLQRFGGGVWEGGGEEEEDGAACGVDSALGPITSVLQVVGTDLMLNQGEERERGGESKRGEIGERKDIATCTESVVGTKNVGTRSGYTY